LSTGSKIGKAEGGAYGRERGGAREFATWLAALGLTACSGAQSQLTTPDGGDGGSDAGQTQQTCIGPDGCDGFYDNSAQPVCNAPRRNNCGICGSVNVDGIGASCQHPNGNTGIQVCNADGGTICATTVVTLTVDDTFEDAPMAADAFEAYGFHGTFFVNSPRFNRLTGYMSLDQALDLQHRGHEVGGHTLDHPHLTAMDPDQQHVEMCRDRATLLSLGLDIKDFAYPFGQNDASTQQAARDCNFNVARQIGGISDSSRNPSAESFVPQNSYAIRTVSSLGLGTDAPTIEGYVESAEVDGGGWLIINMHRECDPEALPPDAGPCSTISVAPSDLNTFLHWLSLRIGNGTVVQTLRQMVWGETKPAVSWSLSPDPDGGNWLRNPSLEIDTSDAGFFPDCWQPFGAGNNDTAWDAGMPHTGDAGVQLTVSNFVSGARGLMSSHDFGGCSPVLPTGSSYRVSAWYIAPENTPVFQMDYLANGTWLTWQFSPPFPASSTYTEAVWVTPSLPAEVQQISVGLMLTYNGTLTVDDLAITEVSQ
jgi:peptidoglycan/xylan/chitin deacetylase (PgdA/CDA1 family)